MNLKSVVCHYSLRDKFPAPSHLVDFKAIEDWNIGFDVEQRSSVQRIYAENRQAIAIDIEKSNSGEAYWIGPGRRAGRK